MQADLEEALTDTVYRTVLEPDAWAGVMRLTAEAFPSNAQTFYFLDKLSGRVQPVALEGIAPRWLDTFDALYFAPDNPWIKVSHRLHRPGVVRTNERLARLLRDQQALYRSAYYNDWMRPQDFRTTLGTTLFAEEDVVANVTLLRAPDMPTFGPGEVAAFERLSRHMTRALRMGVQLERAEASGLGPGTFEGMRQGMALIDRRLRVVHANRAMERVLREGTGLMLRDGRLATPSVLAQQHLQAMVDAAVSPLDPAAPATHALQLPLGPGAALTVRAMPARGGRGHYMPAQALALLTVARTDASDPVPWGILQRRYACTPAETRLVMGMVNGLSLREAAAAAGTSYESARTTLKRVFVKLGVHSQSQLISRLLRELPPPH